MINEQNGGFKKIHTTEELSQCRVRDGKRTGFNRGECAKVKEEWIGRTRGSGLWEGKWCVTTYPTKDYTNNSVILSKVSTEFSVESFISPKFFV
jgi:hypothetical protein